MSDVNGQRVEVLGFDDAGDLPIAVQVRVDSGPISGIALTADGHRLLVTNYRDDSVSIVDSDTCRVVDTVAGIPEPGGLTVAAGRAYFSCASATYDSIQVVDLATNTVTATYPLALNVSDFAVSRDGKHVYVTRNGARGADVAVLNTMTGAVQPIELASAPGVTAECVSLSQDGTRLYVGANGPFGGRIVVIDTGVAQSRPRRSRRSEAHSPLRVLGTIDIGLLIRDIAISPSGGTAYVASCGPDFGAVLDIVDTHTNKVINTRKFSEIGGVLTGLTLSQDGTRAYLISDDSLTLVSTLTQDIVGSVTATAQPSCVVESPDGQHLYVADYAGTVTVVPVASDVGPAALPAGRSAEFTAAELLEYQPAFA
ncbi:YncE family protein [Mycobacterium sp. 1423905.2]|uniref:YncE family protein n=1 Tax=Mycobacterium sp. 1423905.2 TaxID=1856859 RepID=UPI0007FCA354|nr:YncE family protein [Mycobacterium sp. 1423905.2]OBJ50564.1 hypothetical protein A9W95_23780 [Mycobacterium sp. 1423905.2]